MSKKIKYIFYKCRDCEMDFLISRTHKNAIHCPLCGEGMYTEKLMDLWIERPFQYKRPWTPEEDELIVTGKRMKFTEKRISESLDGRTYRAVGRRWQQIKKRMENHNEPNIENRRMG